MNARKEIDATARGEKINRAIAEKVMGLKWQERIIYVGSWTPAGWYEDGVPLCHDYDPLTDPAQAFELVERLLDNGRIHTGRGNGSVRVLNYEPYFIPDGSPAGFECQQTVGNDWKECVCLATLKANNIDPETL